VAHRGFKAVQLGRSQRLEPPADALAACAGGARALPLGSDVVAGTFLGQLLGDMGCQAILLVPAISRERVWGCLFAGLNLEPLLDAQEQAFLNSIGRIAGMAIDIDGLRKRREHRLSQSQALYQVSQALGTTLDLDQLLSLIVRLAVDTVTQAQNGVLHLLDEATGELRPRALSFVPEVRPDATGQSRMRIGSGVAGYALEAGRVVNVPDVSRDPRFVRAGGKRSFAAMLVAPLILADHRIGTLSIDSAEPRAFSTEDESLAMILATQAASAIENARLVSDLQRSLEDLKATQERLIQSAKLSAIGQLVAGMAHELNNPLTAVMGYAELLQTSDGASQAIRSDLREIHAHAERAARIVRNLLTFAQQDETEHRFIDVNTVLKSCLETRAYQLSADNIEVITHLDRRVLGTMADPVQLQQVFFNLINNAHEAIKGHGAEGHITIASELRGDKILVKVEDDGPGLAPTVREHIFEPFFTTGEVGSSLGLGLSVSYGIVSEHGGRIWVESEPGEGATFVVELPACLKGHRPWCDESNSARPVKAKWVLVIQNRDDMAAALEGLLSEDGHRVLLAKDGEAALERLAEARDREAQVDLIISGLDLPGSDGPALYESLSRQDPELVNRLVLVTDVPLSSEAWTFLRQVGLPYLTRPFTIRDLRRVIGQVFHD